MARTLFKEFAEKEVKPLAQEVDETEIFPRGTVEKMAKAGFLGNLQFCNMLFSCNRLQYQAGILASDGLQRKSCHNASTIFKYCVEIIADILMLVKSAIFSLPILLHIEKTLCQYCVWKVICRRITCVLTKWRSAE